MSSSSSTKSTKRSSDAAFNAAPTTAEVKQPRTTEAVAVSTSLHAATPSVVTDTLLPSLATQIAEVDSEIKKLAVTVVTTENQIAQVVVEMAAVKLSDPKRYDVLENRLTTLQQKEVSLWAKKAALQQQKAALQQQMVQAPATGAVDMPPGSFLCFILCFAHPIILHSAHLSLIEQLAWIVGTSIAEQEIADLGIADTQAASADFKKVSKTTILMKKPADRGTSRADAGRVTSTGLFRGELFDSRYDLLAGMLTYMIALPGRSAKPVDISVVVDSPGAGKSFMLQRAYETPMASIASFSNAAVADADFASLDACTMRLILSFNHNMNTAVDAVFHLVSRVLLTYFCGYPSADSTPILTRIGARVNALWRAAGSDAVLQRVLSVLEHDFASHRGVDAESVRTILFVDEAGTEKLAQVVAVNASGTKTLVDGKPTVRRDVCSALDRRNGSRGAIFTALQKQIPDFAVFTESWRQLLWFAVAPLPVHSGSLLALARTALSNFGNVDDRMADVANALALTGGHAYTVELVMLGLEKEVKLADSRTVNVPSVRRAALAAKYKDRLLHVQSWFGPSLLGVKFSSGSTELRCPLDVARAAGVRVVTQ
jgi:hypothetical protein